MTSAASHICMSCGICCDGTLFTHVQLREAEDDPPAGFAFDITVDEGIRHFTQPCKQLGASGCRAYEARPVACRKYACASLKTLAAGEIDEEELRRRTGLAREAVAAARRFLLPGESLRDAQLRWARTAGSPGRNPGDAAFLVAFAALHRVLDRYFRSDDQNVFQPGPAGTAMPG